MKGEGGGFIDAPRRTSTDGRLHRLAHRIPAALIVLVFSLLYRGDLDREPPEPEIAAPPTVATTPLARSWRAAAAQVEEPRGEPTGRAARVAVPGELAHYADTRRFLAVQVASWRQQDSDLPHDDAALVEIIRREGFVELPPLGDHYILYGVGANASEDPLVHVESTGAEIPLYPRYDMFEDSTGESIAEIEKLEVQAKDAGERARRLTRKQARQRRVLQAEVRQARRRAAEIRARQARLRAWYGNYDRRRLLVNEWNSLQEQAAAFSRPYDLEVPAQRRAFRARLLSHLRASARDVLLEIARAYHERYDRPLPVTSLVRHQAYQRQLGETNPNATRIDVPPHATGFAFDLYYRYMTAEEQGFLMRLIADMERAGRLEALRERRDHIHVFAFAQGEPPPASLIAEALRDVGPGRTRRPTARAATRSARTKTSLRSSAARRAAARATKAPARKAPRRR